MIYNYKATSTLDLSFDDELQQLIINEDIIVEESLCRKMKEMRSLFKDAKGYEDEQALYYMYNNIYRPEHRDLFRQNGIKYEYTILLPDTINGEYIKAHGHIHGISPITKTNYLEVYEVLGGNGYFELFKMEEDYCEVILLKVREGDFVVIPPGYYHLSINTGNIPFNFGDLIVVDPQSDYGLLRTYNGAPLLCLKDENGEAAFIPNENYQDIKLDVKTVDADSVPWNIPLAKEPLYSHFVSDPAYFSILK